jgi:hypothetical protein
MLHDGYLSVSKSKYGGINFHGYSSSQNIVSEVNSLKREGRSDAADAHTP